MQNCVSSILQAPITYINELRNMKRNSIMMSGTSFYPSFILSVIFGYGAMLALAGYFIYFFIVNDQGTCYQSVSVGIIILACLYPIQSTIAFACLIGSAGTSQTKCWKFFITIFFGLLVSGLGFGGLGFVYLCILSQEYPLSINLSFATNQSFIQAVVYIYLTFIILYLVLVPLLTYSYNSRQQQQNLDRDSTNTCCDTLCCIFYYFFQFVFFLSILFMVCLKIMGPIILVYDLVEVGRAHLANSSNQTAFYALTIIGIFGPLAIFLIIYIITCCCCASQGNDINSEQTQMTETSRSNNNTFLTNKDGKHFEDDQYTLGNKKL